MLTPETILQGRYRIVRQLGQGGMGAVYEALDTRLDTTVALKETLFAEERLRKQFEREARLLARMHHPALPRVSDHFAEGDGEFLVMQFIAGDDLAEMVTQRRGPFPQDQVLTWADQLLDALDYLHTYNPQIIHRDIKPQNLKLTSRGQIILLDFGLAKGQASEVSRVTTSASIFGYTPNYAPLEQIQGLGTDARSDIYALAATLYHLMTGVKPPDALTRAAALVNSQPDPLRPAHEVNLSISPAVAAVLDKAMSQNRDQRYGSAAEMQRALQGTGSEATLLNRSEANTMLFPPTVPAGPPVTQLNEKQPTVQTGETTVVRTPPRRRATWAVGAAAVVLALCGGGFYAYQHRNNSAEETLPAADAQPASSAQSELSGGEASASTGSPEEIKQVEVHKQQIASEEGAARKQKAAQQKETTRKQSEDQAGGAEEDRESSQSRTHQTQEDHPSEPSLPETPPEAQRGSDTVIMSGGTTVRRLADGTQIITFPDGRRMMVRPDGTRQVLRPGQRVNRRNSRRP